MPSVTLPADVQHELDQRREALQVAENILRDVDAEVNLILSEMDNKKRKYSKMRDQLINEINLIELIAKSLSERVEVNGRHHTTTSAVVLRVMAAADGPLREAEIMEATGLNRRSVGRTLHNLRRKSLVNNDLETRRWSVAFNHDLEARL
jgi:CRP-like cAMP-binding protein